MVLASALSGAAKSIRTLSKVLHELFLERAGFAFYDDALPGFHLRDFQIRQVSSVNDHVRKASEHLLHLSEVLVLGEALLDLVAVSAGFHLADGNNVTKLIRPGVEVGKALRVQKVALQITLHGVKLNNAVHNGGSGCEHDATSAVQLLEVADLHVEVKCPLAAFLVSKVSDTLHLGRVEKVLEIVGLVHEQSVNAKLLKVDVVYVLFAVAQLFQLRFKRLLAALHIADRRVLTGCTLTLQNRHFQGVNLALVKCFLVCCAHGDGTELLIAHNNRVIIAGGNTVGEQLAVCWSEIVGFQDQNLCGREVVQEFITPLCNQILRGNNQRLFHDAKLAQLHSGGGHFVGLASAHTVGKQRVTAAVDNALNRVFLVRTHFHFRVAAVDGQVAAVILGRYGVVENIVVEAAQLCPAGFIGPHPALELRENGFHLLLGSRRGLLVQDALISNAAPHGDSLIVESGFEDAASAADKRVIFCSPGGCILRPVPQPTVVDLHKELTDRAVVLDLNSRNAPTVLPRRASAAQHFTRKRGINAVRHPGSAKAHLDLFRRDVCGDNLLQGFNVPFIFAVAFRQGFRIPQFCADVAGEVQFSGFQIAVPVLEGKTAFQNLTSDAIGVPSGELRNPLHVHAASLIHGDGKCLFHGVSMGGGRNRRDGIFREDSRLRGRSAVLVVVFQGADKGSVHITGQQLLILGAVQNAVLLDESVIQGVQLLAGIGNSLFTAVVKLQIQQIAGGVPDIHNVCDALNIRTLELCGLYQLAAIVLVELAVSADDCALLGLPGVSLDLRSDFLLGALDRVIHLDLDVTERLFDLLLQRQSAIQRIIGHDGAPILALTVCGGAQNHFRVVHEILVDLVTSVHVRAFPGLSCDFKEALSLVCRAGFPLLEYQNIRHNAGSGSFKCGVGEADRADQVSLLHEVAAGVSSHSVHRSAAGNQAGDAAGSQLIKALCYKVIVDGLRDAGRIGFIGNRDISKRNVADNQVHVVVRDFGGLVPLHADIRVRIEVLRNIAGDLVQLNSGPGLYAACHLLRHGADEAPDTGRRFQHTATSKANPCKAVIHTLNNRWFRIIGVQDGSSCRLILAIVKQLLQLLELLCPVSLLFVKGVRNAAPSGVLRKGLLLLWRGRPAIRHDRAQGLDRIGIGLESRFWGGGELYAALRGNDEVLSFRLLLVSEFRFLLNLGFRGCSFRGFLGSYFFRNFLRYCFANGFGGNSTVGLICTGALRFELLMEPR